MRQASRVGAADHNVVNTQDVLDHTDKVGASKLLGPNGSHPRLIEKGGCGSNCATHHWQQPLGQETHHVEREFFMAAGSQVPHLYPEQDR